ncbi:MAG: hypothetical protein K6L80_15430 [Agarilytica sp.]
MHAQALQNSLSYNNAIEIISFESDADLLEDFIDFPWQLYRGNTNWIPPSKENLRYRLSKSHHFFDHGQARHFIAYGKNREVLGRVTANINYRLIIEGEQIGHVGFFESIDDYSVTEALLDSAMAYLYEHGIKTIWGPINYATLYEYRFVTKGFDKKTFFSDVYNPPYYPEFFQRYGFSQLRGYYTDYNQDKETVLKKYQRFRRRFDNMGYSTRNVDLSNYDNEMRLLYDLLFRCFSDNFAFTHFDYAEFFDLYKKYKTLIEPKHLKFALNQNGEEIGFYLAFPDLSGQHDNAFLTKMVGVLPGYIHVGVGMALTHEMFQDVIEVNYDYSIVPFRIEGNPSLKFGKGLCSGYKEYGLFEYKVP